MHKNVGYVDRVLRVLLAAGAIAGSGVFGFSGAGGILLLVAAGVLLLTAASGICPAYSILGVDTLHHEERTRRLGPFSAHHAA